MIEITEEDFDPNSIISDLRKERIGAIVTFLGTVRGFKEVSLADQKNRRVEVKHLIYESYKDMALKKMEEIREYSLAHHDIHNMHIVHRVGTLKPAEQIVLIAVAAAHRKDAFTACQYAIEELKKSVPIWKKEVTSKSEHWIGHESQSGDKI